MTTMMIQNADLDLAIQLHINNKTIKEREGSEKRERGEREREREREQFITNQPESQVGSVQWCTGSPTDEC
jgi:hypothetical protein